MSLVKIAVTHHDLSGLPEDDIVNTFHFGTDPGGITTQMSADFEIALDAFWHGNPTQGGVPLDAYLSGRLDRTKGRDYDIYVKETGEKDFGSPVDIVRGKAFSAVGSNANLPAEVALCGSFHGDLTDIPEEAGVTRPAARRRGRIYVGPLNTAAQNTTGTAVVSRPAQQFIDCLANRIEILRLSSEAVPEWSWGVAHAASTAAWTFTKVEGGWVDNEWDTQRRRGHLATQRTAIFA